MVLVAVYGSLKKGFHNHRLLQREGVIYKGEAWTEPNYTMYNLGSFPGVIEDGRTPIKVEVYEVPDKVRKDLDRLEGYHGEGRDTNMYNKTTVDTPYGKAVMYIINKNYLQYNRGVVDTGDWAFKY